MIRYFVVWLKRMPPLKKYLIITILSLILLGLIMALPENMRKSSLMQPIFGVSVLNTAKDIWFPKGFSKENEVSDENLIVTAEAALFADINSGEVLYQKNALKKLRIASLTKVMTAIIALENKNLDDQFFVSEKASLMEPDKMYLKLGETLTLKELLQGIFLVSANDAAEVLAEGVFKDREKFILEMNKKALELGMNASLFINPSGLEEDESTEEGILKDHYSTALDVLLMSRYAIKRWSFLTEDITSKSNIELVENDYHRAYSLQSGINLVTTYPGVLGFKTGYTPEAGLTLITYAKKGDREIVGVLLNSIKRREDAKILLDYSFDKLGIK